MSTANKTVAFFSGVTQAPTKPHIRRDPQSDVWASGYYSRGLVVFCRTYISQADQLKLKMIRWLTLLDYTKRVRPVDMNELMMSTSLCDNDASLFILLVKREHYAATVATCRALIENG